MDADERMTKELALEIKTSITYRQSPITNNQSPITHHQPLTTSAAYYVPRKNIFARKKWLQYGGWNPDIQIRLIHIPSLISWPKQIHSTPQIKGTIGTLKHELIHYFHGDIESMVTKTISFEQIEADLLYKADKSVSVRTFFRKYAGELYRRLIKKTGFRDGPIGIIESIYQAFSKTITYLFLYEKKNSRSL